MNGWAMLALIAAGTVAALALLRFPRKLWTVPATALLLGGAGYAWQGAPGLAGHPVTSEEEAREIDPKILELREAMFGRFNFDASYFLAADAMTRVGSPRAAVNVMIGAVRKAPQDAALWTWLGVVLSEHDGNQISPPAKFAFERGIALWPTHPGPEFFYGLAQARQGNFTEARTHWAKAFELTPEKASYREELGFRLALIDRLIAMQAAQARGEAPPPMQRPEAMAVPTPQPTP